MPPEEEPKAGLIYHLALSEEWHEAVQRGGLYHRSTLGRSLADVGFIHCSFADQVETIADLAYRGRDDVLLLAIDSSRVQSQVRIENLEGSKQFFPHIYGPLPVAAVIRVTSVPVDGSGRLAVAEVL